MNWEPIINSENFAEINFSENYFKFREFEDFQRISNREPRIFVLTSTTAPSGVLNGIGDYSMPLPS
jgi:hypothetical protein